MIRNRSVLCIFILVFALTWSGGMSDVYAAAGSDTGQGSSFDYKNYRDSEHYKLALKKKMKNVYTHLSDSIDDDDTLPIPGLISTSVSKDGSYVESDRFIPQGICVTSKYILTTAYDSKKKLNSVIYVIDRRDHTLVSTLTLPNKYHVGGITYDGNNIWLPGETSDKYKGQPFLQYIRYNDFRKMIQSSLYSISKEEMSRRIYIKNKPSYMTYANGRVWVGTYIGKKDTKESYLNGYEVINKSGGKTTLNTIMYTIITGFDSSSQGADIDGNYLYVSSSYKGNIARVRSSFVTKYDISPVIEGRGTLYVDDREISRYEVPKMNEEIVIFDGTVNINFEAGAKRWISSVIHTDRLLSVDKDLWGKDEEKDEETKERVRQRTGQQ